MTPSDTPKFTTREAWLNCVAGQLAPVFEDLGAPLPAKIRIAIGFTSTGRRGRSIGECWSYEASDDGHYEIIIRPDLAEARDALPGAVAAILAHELVHAAVGIPAGHGPAFRRVARAIGLVGKMTATVAGPQFRDRIAPALAHAGPLPHGRLFTSAGGGGGGGGGDGTDEAGERTSTAPRKQPSRMVRCTCETCGYTVRTARHWIKTKGAPLCPTDGPMQVKGFTAEAVAAPD